jgi:PAS domain S-box-containing protein
VTTPVPIPISAVERRRLAPSARELTLFVALAAAYVVAAWIGFRAALVADQVSPVWPPTGLALWAVLRFGNRVWPGIWLGALVANATTEVPLLPAAAIAAGNTLEALAGAWLLRRFADVDRSLDRLHQVVMLVVGAASTSTIISASIGVTTLCLWGLQPWARFGTLWWTWWLGDATGNLLVASLLLTVPVWQRIWNTRAILKELIVLEGFSVAVTMLVFATRPPRFAESFPLEFAVFPIVMWAGLRFAHPGAALVSATISCIAVWGTLRGGGPFSVGPLMEPQESVILLQIFTAAIAASGLVFGAAIADRYRAERLRETDHALTAILSQEPDLKSAAPRIARTVCETLGWDVGILWRVDDEQNALVCVDSWQLSDRVNDFVADSRTRRFMPGVGLPGRVWTLGRPAWIPDVVIDPNFPRAAVATRVGLHGGFGFPILLEGRVFGVIEFFTRDPRPPDASLLTLMAAAGSQIGQFIERRRAEQQIARSEALTSAIVNAALDCIISIDANGNVLEFNPAAVQTFGFSRDQVLGRELAAIIVPERLRAQHRAAVRRAVETGEGRVLGRRMEMAALKADGTEVTVELAITRVLSGPRPIFTAHLRDITDRKRIEEERRELLERERAARLDAENANRSKDLFLATVSHELRTPLTAILGWASMLQSHQFEPERVPQIYERIFKNAQAQTQIVNDLLDVSRIVSGQLRLEWQRTDLCEIARLSLETIRPTALAKGVTLESRIPAEPCFVSGDPARLQQVMWNLLSNAAKFTPAGGTVSLALGASASGMSLEVADTGIGIPAAFLPRLFERFWQADSTSTRTHGGLGLGLALVRHIVEAHGGFVKASSEGEGRGSRFVVHLPATLPEPSEPEAAQPSRAAQRADAADLHGVTALVVDDDPTALELFAEILEEHGARAIGVPSAAAALARLAAEPVDAMVIDIGLPGEDGLMLLGRIRALEAERGRREAPAIAVSAYASANDQAQALTAGFVAHIAKPALPEVLLAAVLQSVSAEPRRRA